MMKYEAAIFDLDGTLIDSTWVWASLLEKFCNFLDIKDKLKCMGETAHMPPGQFSRYIKEKFFLKQSEEEIKATFLKIATDFYSNKIPLKKGVERFLKIMRENLIKISIATSCFAELTEIVLKKWGIYDFFSCFVFSEDLNTNKMFADVYLAAADNMGVSYEKCAVFEDISLPLNAVKKYKMGYFGVYDENRSDEVKKELELKSDFYIKDYDEFIEKGYVEKFFHLKGE